MWIINLIQTNIMDSPVAALLGVGSILCVISIVANTWIIRQIPIIKHSIVLLQIISIILLVVGAYFKGSQLNETKWQSKMAETQQKMVILEQKAVKINLELAKKTEEKTKVIRVKGDTIYRYIDKEVVKDKEVIKFIEHCPIPAKILELHNAAATNTPLDESIK